MSRHSPSEFRASPRGLGTPHRPTAPRRPLAVPILAGIRRARTVSPSRPLTAPSSRSTGLFGRYRIPRARLIQRADEGPVGEEEAAAREEEQRAMQRLREQERRNRERLLLDEIKQVMERLRDVVMEKDTQIMRLKERVKAVVITMQQVKFLSREGDLRRAYEKSSQDANREVYRLSEQIEKDAVACAGLRSQVARLRRERDEGKTVIERLANRVGEMAIDAGIGVKSTNKIDAKIGPDSRDEQEHKNVATDEEEERTVLKLDARTGPDSSRGDDYRGTGVMDIMKVHAKTGPDSECGEVDEDVDNNGDDDIDALRIQISRYKAELEVLREATKLVDVNVSTEPGKSPQLLSVPAAISASIHGSSGAPSVSSFDEEGADIEGLRMTVARQQTIIDSLEEDLRAAFREVYDATNELTKEREKCEKLQEGIAVPDNSEKAALDEVDGLQKQVRDYRDEAQTLKTHLAEATSLGFVPNSVCPSEGEETLDSLQLKCAQLGAAIKPLEKELQETSKRTSLASIDAGERVFDPLDEASRDELEDRVAFLTARLDASQRSENKLRNALVDDLPVAAAPTEWGISIEDQQKEMRLVRAKHALALAKQKAKELQLREMLRTRTEDVAEKEKLQGREMSIDFIEEVNGVMSTEEGLNARISDHEATIDELKRELDRQNRVVAELVAELERNEKVSGRKIRCMRIEVQQLLDREADRELGGHHRRHSHFDVCFVMPPSFCKIELEVLRCRVGPDALRCPVPSGSTMDQLWIKCKHLEEMLEEANTTIKKFRGSGTDSPISSQSRSVEGGQCPKCRVLQKEMAILKRNHERELRWRNDDVAAYKAQTEALLVDFKQLPPEERDIKLMRMERIRWQIMVRAAREDKAELEYEALMTKHNATQFTYVLFQLASVKEKLERSQKALSEACSEAAADRGTCTKCSKHEQEIEKLREKLSDAENEVEMLRMQRGRSQMEIAMLRSNEEESGLPDEVSVDEIDQNIQRAQNAEAVKAREAQEKAEALRKYGRPGKGNGEGYMLFCKKCFTEYVSHTDRCGRCGNEELTTREERLSELHSKARNLQRENAAHAWRKDKWERWLRSRQLVPKSRVINYQKWEYWEPDSDTEDEGEPIVPHDDPNFKALEADMKKRNEARQNRAKTANKYKERGNARLREGDFAAAIEEYDGGLEFQKDNKALWTNKALAELKLGRFEQAVDSCSKVLEMVEIFEDDYSQSADACTKALLRRSAALQNLKRWEAAKCDAEEALRLGVASAEAQAAIDTCDRHLAEINSLEEDGGEDTPNQNPFKRASSETVQQFLLDAKRPPLGKISDIDESLLLAALSIDAEALKKVVHCGGLENLLENLSRAALLHRNTSIEDPDGLRNTGLLRCLRLLIRICELSDIACEIFASKAGAHIARLVQFIKAKIRCGRCVALMAELSTRPVPRKQLQEILCRDGNGEVVDTIIKRVACRKRSSAFAALCVLANCATNCQTMRLRLQKSTDLPKALISKVSDLATAEQAAGVICNVGGDAIAESCSVALLRACAKVRDEKSAMSILGALQNCCTISIRATESVLEQEKAESVLCSIARRLPSTIGRVLTILLRLSQVPNGGIRLVHDSEAVVLADGVIANASRSEPSVCDPAIRLLCQAIRQDSACLSPELVRGAVDLLMMYPPNGYDDRDKTLYMLRGNACLIIAAAADMTQAGSKLYAEYLTKAVVPMLECLRKQDQANAGSALAKCCMASEKCNDLLREQGGLDTLWKMQNKLLRGATANGTARGKEIAIR
ncbi:hypothetical protein FOL47_005061 [Perkinsus chesapeaki]|uniref:Protein unc-45 homolog B n=1 Tax=Perkinsus chesapeaki TaxID=330153 RepID=A0A7J6LZB1_PERCH|nr:hypothetical protein FOL47_005061 [Perkinsus chesapeaki]